MIIIIFFNVFVQLGAYSKTFSGHIQSLPVRCYFEQENQASGKTAKNVTSNQVKNSGLGVEGSSIILNFEEEVTRP